MYLNVSAEHTYILITVFNFIGLLQNAVVAYYMCMLPLAIKMKWDLSSY